MGLLSYFRRPPLPETRHQMNVHDRAIVHLVKHGTIDVVTIINMGYTSPHRLINRLRRQGYLNPYGFMQNDERRDFFEVPNKNAQGKRRVHYWSGKEPPKREVGHAKR